MPYSSKDFDKVSSTLQPKLPQTLIHRDVEQAAVAQNFSEERGHGVAIVDLPSRTISMTIGHLKPEEVTRKHRHNYETVIFILEGEGASEIGEELVKWRTGDAIYVPPWSWHCHRNGSTTQQARYVACENAPLLQNIGEIAVREEL